MVDETKLCLADNKYVSFKPDIEFIEMQTLRL